MGSVAIVRITALGPVLPSGAGGTVPAATRHNGVGFPVSGRGHVVVNSEHFGGAQCSAPRHKLGNFEIGLFMLESEVTLNVDPHILFRSARRT